MSAASNTYACEACTFVQSIKRPTCEMCQTVNPHFPTEDYQPLNLNYMFPLLGDGTTQCPSCAYINIGSHVQICEGCGQNLQEALGSLSLDVDDEDLTNGNESEKSHDDDDDVIIVEDGDNSRSKGSQGKAAAAVEKGMTNSELLPYYNRYLLIVREQRQPRKIYSEKQLHSYITDLFNSLEYRNDQSAGQLTFSTCQICCSEDGPMVTMKACNHCVLCADDFNRYLSFRIRDGDILPWIPCPAESCSVPCHAENIIRDGHLTYGDLLLFLSKYMLKKLSRNENFITCIQCEEGGFLQLGPPKKQQVRCSICNEKQTIEKGADGDLDIAFKKMIKSGQLRECPTCRHLTLKEKGLCNIIECAKCGIWWNWRTREQGHNGTDMKQRARISGTLWEPGELQYQQELEHRNPKKFKALLERNGVKYDPNYVRGDWNDE